MTMIRPMTAEDIPSIQDIARDTWRETYHELIPEEIQLKFIQQAYSTAMMLMRMEKTIVLIAESNGKTIGFANFTRKDEDGDAELTALYILPAYQQAGYGKKLLEAGLSYLQDAQQLFVYVDGRNEGGRFFYEKQGFDFLEEFEELFEGHPVVTAQYVYQIHEMVYSNNK
jgi:ribosomal protein S18 acetylase RimI-like enzyme